MSAMLRLVRPRKPSMASAVMKESKPFVMNDRASLIHRPREIQLFNIHQEPHLAIKQWCGNSHTGMREFTFLDQVPEGRVLCAACELRAVLAGRPSADEVCGRHVHKGRLFVRITCCATHADSGRENG